MRPLLVIAVWTFGLAIASSVVAAAGPPIELTPQNMADKGFSVECRFRDQTIKEGDKPTRPTGVVLVQVIFDAEKGPSIQAMNSAALVVKLGEQSMWIPLQWSAGPQPGFIQFAIPDTMIATASVVLEKGGEMNPSSFAVALQKFRK
jgi:hypothetical protein